jgi:hypothetical protein
MAPNEMSPRPPAPAPKSADYVAGEERGYTVATAAFHRRMDEVEALAKQHEELFWQLTESGAHDVRKTMLGGMGRSLRHLMSGGAGLWRGGWTIVLGAVTFVAGLLVAKFIGLKS